MASWIVHLRIAEGLLRQGLAPDAAAFAVGNVAPDSGIPDEKWEHFSPPPEVSHFQDPSSLRRNLADLDFARAYLLPLQACAQDKVRHSFLLGYFCHLVTDNLWAVRVGRPTRQKFMRQFEADKDFIWQVKRDWYGLDFEYVRSHPGCLFWTVFLPAHFNGDYLDFMPLANIQRQVEYIKSFYQRADADVEDWYIRRPGVYLSESEMDAFVEDGVKILAHAVQVLRAEAFDPGVRSILQALDA